MFILNKIIIDVYSFSLQLRQYMNNPDLDPMSLNRIGNHVISRLLEDIYLTSVIDFNRNNHESLKAYYTVKCLWPDMEKQFSYCITTIIPYKVMPENISAQFDGMSLIITNQTQNHA